MTNSIFGILFLIFLVLKLTGYIAWSWFWVFSPLLAGLVVAILAFIVLVVMATKRGI
jgi:hypothetical protein